MLDLQEIQMYESSKQVRRFLREAFCKIQNDSNQRTWTVAETFGGNIMRDDEPSTQPQANSETEVPTPTTVVQDIRTQTDVTSTTELQNIREEYEEALHVLHLDDMVEEELDSLEAFAKSMETDDSGDSGVDE